ncbi:MAG TPA: ATP-binding protein [Clostridiales bacterium]|nr:ATP-binding protein [Clostridiales bacterium]
MENCSKIDIITGHFGSGKTEFAINYSIQFAKDNLKVALVDLDIVNPFFRTAEVKDILEDMGIKVIVPNFAGTTLDIPSLPADIYGVFDDQSYDKVVFDVGGDDLGAVVLGRYHLEIEKTGYNMFYVINTKRPLSSTRGQIVNMLRSVEESSRLKVTYLINNTNLSYETTSEDIVEGQNIIEKVSKELHIPIAYVTCKDNIVDDLPDDIKKKVFKLNLYMQPIWK